VNLNFIGKVLNLNTYDKIRMKIGDLYIRLVFISDRICWLVATIWMGLAVM